MGLRRCKIEINIENQNLSVGMHREPSATASSDGAMIRYAGDEKPDAHDLASYTLGRTLDCDPDIVYPGGRYIQWPDQVHGPESTIHESEKA